MRATTLITSAPGAYWKTDGQLTEVASGNADVTVSDVSTAQTWEGFGGAFNELGWHYLSMLSETDRDAALQPAVRRRRGALRVRAHPDRGDRLRDRSLHARRDARRSARRHVAGGLLDRPRHAGADPVREGGPGGEGQHSFLGQPVDAADVDEAGAVFVRQPRLAVRRRDDEERRRDDDGVRAVPDQVRAGLRGSRGSPSKRSPRRTSRTTPGRIRPAAGRRRRTRSSSASISARRSRAPA